MCPRLTACLLGYLHAEFICRVCVCVRVCVRVCVSVRLCVRNVYVCVCVHTHGCVCVQYCVYVHVRVPCETCEISQT